MTKKLDIPSIFKSDADDIRKSRENSIRIHGTSDIRAAGDEVEVSIRDYFKRMLPPRYYVTHGHLIDAYGEVSPQLDFIIADNSNIPSLMTTKDGTEYIPIDSVYAIGEIKSTYYKAQKYIEGFSNVLEDIDSRLFHEKIINTAFNGQLTDDTSMRDMALAKGNRILNEIFTFMLFIDTGDFVFEKIAPFFINRPINFLPNMAIFLDSGVLLNATMKDNTFLWTRYPSEAPDINSDWYFSPFHGNDTSSLEGNHLGFLYYNLLEHLANSYLEPPSFKHFVSQMMQGRKSLLKKAKLV